MSYPRDPFTVGMDETRIRIGNYYYPLFVGTELALLRVEVILRDFDNHDLDFVYDEIKTCNDKSIQWLREYQIADEPVRRERQLIKDLCDPVLKRFDLLSRRGEDKDELKRHLSFLSDDLMKIKTVCKVELRKYNWIVF